MGRNSGKQLLTGPEEFDKWRAWMSEEFLSAGELLVIKPPTASWEVVPESYPAVALWRTDGSQLECWFAYPADFEED